MSELRDLYQKAFDAFAAQEYDTAIEGYQAVIDKDPEFALAFQGLAEAHSRKGELAQAVDAIQKAIVLDPDESLFHTSLSRFYEGMGKIPEAEEAAAVAHGVQSRDK